MAKKINKSKDKRSTYEFSRVRDVSFKWVEKLFSDSYGGAKTKVVDVNRATGEDLPWHDVISDSSPAKTVVDQYKAGFDEVRLVLKVPEGYNFLNIKIEELHTDWSYPPPIVS